MPKHDEPVSGSGVVGTIDASLGVFGAVSKIADNYPKGSGKFACVTGPLEAGDNEAILAIEANVPQMLTVALHILERAKMEVIDMLSSGVSDNVAMDAVVIARIERAIESLAFMGVSGKQQTLIRKDLPNAQKGDN